MPASVQLPEAPAAEPTRFAFDRDAYLKDLVLSLDSSARRAFAGEARGLQQVAEWLDYCRGPRSTAEMARNGHAAMLRAVSRDAEDAAFRVAVGEACERWLASQAWLQQEQAQVDAEFRLYQQQNRDQPPGEQGRYPPVLAERLRQRAAAAGDVVAAAGNGLTDVPSTDCGERLRLVARDPVVLRQSLCLHALLRERMRAAFLSRDGLAIASMPIIAWSITRRGLNSEFFHQQPTQVLNALWVLAACEFGYDCGPAGRELRTACMRGVCGYRHYREYARDHELPPASMRWVDARLPRLVALIQQGQLDAILGPPPRY